MPSLFEIGPMVLEMKIIKQCIFSILLLYLLGKGQDPSFEQTWNPFTKECFVIYIKFVWYWPYGSGEDFFFNFHYFFITFISPWKRVWHFIWTILNSLHPKMLCAMIGWNWPSGSGEEDENVKSLQTDRRTDKQADRRRMTGDQKSPLELSAQVS